MESLQKQMPIANRKRRTQTRQTDRQPTKIRRSGRAKRTRGYTAEQEEDENTNSNKLGVFEVPGMGCGLFAKEPFSIKDRIICVYHGKKILRK